MLIKTLSRNPDEYVRETKNCTHKVFRNYDEKVHPFKVEREYTRALNATKLDRVFSKPFVACLDSHSDGVNRIAIHPNELSTVVSGSYDGEIKLWNLQTKNCVKTCSSYNGYVQGLTFSVDGERLYSCGDRIIKCWSTQKDFLTEEIFSISTKSRLLFMDYCRNSTTFLTSGDKIDVWVDDRSVPTNSLKWGCDSINCSKFNPIETNIIASTCSDNSIILYDLRDSTPMKKMVMDMASNSLCWNPMDPSSLTIANEDYNLYTFDIRNFKKARNVHKDHVSSVIDLDYSPTGTEFVSASYDKSLRIFNSNKGHSRDVYTTKRMQRVMCCKWTLDNKFILSGSDETNVRLWKSGASDKMGTLMYREKMHLNYCNSLKNKYKHHPQIKRIANHRHLPKDIYSERKQLRECHDAAEKRFKNKQMNSGKRKIAKVSERKKSIQNVLN